MPLWVSGSQTRDGEQRQEPEIYWIDVGVDAVYLYIQFLDSFPLFPNYFFFFFFFLSFSFSFYKRTTLSSFTGLCILIDTEWNQSKHSNIDSYITKCIQ